MSQFGKNGPSLYLFSNMIIISVPNEIINDKITLGMVDADPQACTMTHVGTHSTST